MPLGTEGASTAPVALPRPVAGRAADRRRWAHPSACAAPRSVQAGGIAHDGNAVRRTGSSVGPASRAAVVDANRLGFSSGQGPVW